MSGNSGNNVTLIDEGIKERIVKVQCGDQYTVITKSKWSGIEVKATDDSTEWAPYGTGTQDLGNLELKDTSGNGGTITDIFFPAPNEVVIFTNTPACYWYWTGRKWIWR